MANSPDRFERFKLMVRLGRRTKCAIPIAVPIRGVYQWYDPASADGPESTLHGVTGFIRQRYASSVLFPPFPDMISRDAEKKAGESAAFGVKPFRVANQRHENFLRHVLGQRRIPAHVQSEPVNGRMFAPVEERKRVFVARQHPPKQAVVCDRYGPIHGDALDGPFCFSLHIPPGAPISSNN
jgi:hypothetical protein